MPLESVLKLCTGGLVIRLGDVDTLCVCVCLRACVLACALACLPAPYQVQSSVLNICMCASAQTHKAGLQWSPATWE